MGVTVHAINPTGGQADKLPSPTHTKALARLAKETGDEVLRGPLRYPSETGGWQLGDIDPSAHLSKYRDYELVLVITATGKAEEQIICGICGAALDKVEECPWCKLANERAARRIRAAMLREVEEILRDEDRYNGSKSATTPSVP